LTGRLRFFQAYAIFLSGLLGFIFWMSLKQRYTWVEWLDLPMTVIALLGVWGYGFSWMRLRGWFWHAVLGGILVWDLVFNFFLRSFTHWGVQSRLAVYEMLAVGFVLFLPEYIALYLYGHSQSKEVPQSRSVRLAGRTAA
jgi:hypothetical protein